MAIDLTHIVDEATRQDGVDRLSLLLHHLPSQRVEQKVVVIDRTPTALAVPAHVQETQ